MSGPLNAVIIVPRRALNRKRLSVLGAAAAGRAGADHSVHLTRYPAFGHWPRAADVQAQSIPAFARELLRHTERTLIPSAVGRELRPAILRSLDWEGTGPDSIAAAAAADREALHELVCRVLGMAA